MNIIKRIFKRNVLLKIAYDLGVADEESLVSALFLIDGFKIKNIKDKMPLEDMKATLLPVFNESTGEDYNHITKRNHDIIISRKNYYEAREAGLYATDLERYTKKINFKFTEVNGILICATSGKGKTTFVKYLIEEYINTKQISIYTPKEEDYQDYKVMNFEMENITTLTEKIKRFNNEPEYRKEVSETIIIDEFLLLCNLDYSKSLIQEINKCLAFNRSSRLKFIFISQTLNKQQLANFNPTICNMILLNQRDIQNYSSTIGEMEKKYKKELEIGRFLKISHDSPPEVLFYKKLTDGKMKNRIL